MKINLLNNSSTKFEYKKVIYDVISQTLKTKNLHNNIEICFMIVNEKEIQEYNKKFRNINKATDVLSFPMFEHSEIESEFSKVSKMPLLLGDIILCLPVAISQANQYNHSLERELAFLCVHATLHLLGYDHETPDDEKIMFDLQENILLSLNYER